MDSITTTNLIEMAIALFVGNGITQMLAMSGSYKLFVWRLSGVERRMDELKREIRAHNGFEGRIIRLETEGDITRRKNDHAEAAKNG